MFLGIKDSGEQGYGQPISVLGTFRLPERGWLIGYAALIAQYDLKVPLPTRIAMVTERDRPDGRDDVIVVRRTRRPANTLAAHLDFALRREGVDLSVLKALFEKVDKSEIENVVRAKVTGIQNRRLWFLYEWLLGTELNIPDLPTRNSVPVIDLKLQVALRDGELSTRHRVVNNLAGTRDFCPMVRWTAALSRYSGKQFNVRAREVIGRTHPDVISRAAAFMLLSDSKSSFDIEGERPPRERIARWGQAIGQAGSHSLSIEEFERLQKLVIDSRFVKLGLRDEGGFIGDHDRLTHFPVPVHISARSDDLPSLMNGIIEYESRTIQGKVDPVIIAAAVAFGFVYIHPFIDGNGRIHRWLIHHVLSASGFTPPKMVFPVSSAILREIVTYKKVLESYSEKLLPLIEWEATESNNITVLNDTSDYYRYFDATAHAEFLYECVEQTIEVDLPQEVKFLESFDLFTLELKQIVDMPKTTAALLHKFLMQGAGKLPARARGKEFSELTEDEVAQIEDLYARTDPKLL